MQPDHLELRNPVFWKSEGWKEEWVCGGGGDQYLGPWERSALMPVVTLCDSGDLSV